jgi:pantetheine-phosphate adenylyltransferase
MMNKVAVFPGSFDPFTKGHEALVREAIELFDRVIVAVGVNTSKQSYFALDKRRAHLASLFTAEPRVEVETFSGLTVDFCKTKGAGFILRGLRDSKDFEFEKSIAHMNESLSGIRTVFLLTRQEYAAINSTIVREIHKNGGAITGFVTNAELLV